MLAAGFARPRSSSRLHAWLGCLRAPRPAVAALQRGCPAAAAGQHCPPGSKPRQSNGHLPRRVLFSPCFSFCQLQDVPRGPLSWLGTQRRPASPAPKEPFSREAGSSQSKGRRCATTAPQAAQALALGPALRGTTAVSGAAEHKRPHVRMHPSAPPSLQLGSWSMRLLLDAGGRLAAYGVVDSAPPHGASEGHHPVLRGAPPACSLNEAAPPDACAVSPCPRRLLAGHLQQSRGVQRLPDEHLRLRHHPGKPQHYKQ